MSIIGEVGQQLENSVAGLQEASDITDEGRYNLVEGLSLLRGLVEGSDDPALQEAMDSYARAIQLTGEAIGQIALIGERLSAIAGRMGYVIEEVLPPSPPIIKIIGILEPTPADGDRGDTTPEQFRLYEEKEESVNRLIDLCVDPTTIEGHIAEGGTCHVYRTSDGNIIKLPIVRFEDENRDEANEPMPPPAGTAWYGYAEALKAVKGEEGLEQYMPTSTTAALPEEAPLFVSRRVALH